MQTHDETASYREQNRTTAQLALWTLVWLATVAVASFGPTVLWGGRPVVSWVAVAVNALACIAWVVAIARFLRAQDDLWRKITQDALVATLGVGWVVGFGFLVADTAGLITQDLNIGLFPGFLGTVYMVAVAVGWVRYR